MLLKIQDALDFIFEKKIIWVFFKNKNVQKQKKNVAEMNQNSYFK